MIDIMTYCTLQLQLRPQIKVILHSFCRNLTFYFYVSNLTLPPIREKDLFKSFI